MKQIKYKDEYLTLNHYKEPLREVKKGYGYMGALLCSVDGEKIQCHICGNLFSDLSGHVRQTHDVSVSDYRDTYGLAHTTALISEIERQKRKERTLVWVREMKAKLGEQGFKNYAKEKGRNAAKFRKAHQPKERLERKNIKGTCPDQLIEKIIEVEKKLGHTPSKNEFIDITGSQRYVHLIYATFGSWTKAVKKAGLELKKNIGNTQKKIYNHTDEELLELLQDYHRSTGKIPTETDSRRGFIPPTTTYRAHFGSLPKARELAGIYETPSRWK